MPMGQSRESSAFGHQGAVDANTTAELHQQATWALVLLRLVQTFTASQVLHWRWLSSNV